MKTVAPIPDEQLLPQGEFLVTPEDEELPVAQSAPKRGHGRGRRPKGRRISASTTSRKHKREK